MNTQILAFAAALIALAGCAGETPKTSANGCPQWAESPADSHSNADSAGLGCANALNLRHMAEDPGDLKHGRDLGPADGARQAKAVKNYQEDKVKKSSGSGNSQPNFAPAAAGGSEGQ